MQHESLSPYTRESGDGGVTGTKTAQSQFAQRLRGVLSRINARTREAVVEDDIFLLTEDTEALVDDVPEDVFNTSTRRARVLAFLGWLRKQLDDHFLTVVTEDSNQFINRAYRKGIRDAISELRDENVLLQSAEIDDITNRPIHASALRNLYTRTYENLESVRDSVAQSVRDVLVEGFAEGKNPRDLARKITDRVDSIGKHRATLVARSEIINAHSEAMLNQYESVDSQADVDITLQHGDWQATPDNRTCEFCSRLSGTALRFSEMRGERVEFRGQVYRLKPPAHPNGRCTILPNVGGDVTERLENRLPASFTLLT